MADWHTTEAPAKLNLALVVGPRRPDGRHEVVTVLERLSLHDTVAVRRAETTVVTGYEDDSLVLDALRGIGRIAAGSPCFEAQIEKRIPVAAGLGGGSSDAAAALRLGNELLETPLAREELEVLAASLGADVPFFLRDGPQLGTGDGTTLAPVALPRGYTVLLALLGGATKTSTADVYAAFDVRRGELGFDERREALVDALDGLATAAELAELPSNDLATSPLADELGELGAFRADVTGAGPVVYGLFADEADARRAARALERRAATWIAAPG